MKKQAHKSGWLWLGLIVSLLLLLSACGGGGGGGGDDTPTPTAPSIGLNLTSVGFTSADLNNRTIILSNTGDQELAWELSAPTVNWFSVAPSGSQTLAGHGNVNLTVSLVTANLPPTPGTYSGTFQITSSNADNAPRTISVSLTIAPPAVPLLSSTTSSLSFTVTQGATPANQTIDLTNAGTLALNWNAELTTSNGGNWLTTTGTSNGTLTPGNGTTLTIRVTSAALAAGTYNGTVTVTSDGGNLSIPVTLTVNAAVQTASTSIGGRVNVTQLSSLVASPRARKSAASPGAQSTLLTNAEVRIEVLRDGTTREYRTTTDDNGNYTVQADVVSGDKVTINISKPGYVPFIETVTVTDQNLNSIFNVNGTVAPTNVVAVPLGNALKANGGTTPGFRFGMLRSRDGALKAYRSSAELVTLKASQPQNSSAPFIDVSIPASRVGDGVTSLQASMAGFDSTDPNDRAMFPGEFVGVGGGTAYASKASTTSYPLESVTFMQVDVKEDNGRDLQLTSAAAGSARAAAADPVTVTKWIPSEGCGQMKKYADRDVNAAGVQLPIYTYNSSTGEWGYLGEGTLKAWSGDTYALVSEGSVVGSDGKLSNLACGQTDYYFEIAVNTDWYTWWNLDYPILLDISNKKTIHGKVTNDDGTPVAGTYVYANGASTFYGYTDENGNYSFDMMVDEADLANYTFRSYNNMTWLEVAPQAPPAAGNNYTADFVFTNPYSCKATGAITRGQSPVVNEWVYAWGNSSGYWSYAQTDSDGRFTLSSPCSESVTLWSAYQERNFNVDSAVAGVEQSDNGSVVVLKNIALVNQPPQVYLSAWPTEVRAGDPVELWGWAWDPEYTNITYDWSSTTGKTISGSYYATLDTTGLTGTYTVTLTGTDADGQAASSSVTITVSAPEANKPPVLFDFGYYLDTWTSGVCNPTVILWTSAYDPEGQALAYDWSAPNGTFTSLGGWGEFRWDNAGIVPQDVTLTVRDPQGATSTPLTRTVTPQTQMAPQIWWADAYPNPALIDQPVQLSAYGWIETGANLSYDWTITPPSGTAIEDLGAGPQKSFTPSQSGTYTVEVKAVGCSKASQAYTFSFTVIDNATSNTPPEIWYAGGYQLSQNQLLLSGYAWDLDGDPLTYSWTADSGSFSENNSTAVWVAADGFSGTVNFTLTVSDGTNSTTSTTTYTLDTMTTPAPVVYSVWTDNSPVYAKSTGTLLHVYAEDVSGSGATLTYLWSDLTEPTSLVTEGYAIDAPFWNPTVPGIHTLRVEVSTGPQMTQYDVYISVENEPTDTTVIIQ